MLSIRNYFEIIRKQIYIRFVSEMLLNPPIKKIEGRLCTNVKETFSQIITPKFQSLK